jgi:hypothetical protein
MTTEETRESRLRRATMKCGGCGLPLLIGANYPEGVPVSTLRTLELWCGECRMVTLMGNPLVEKDRTDGEEKD